MLITQYFPEFIDIEEEEEVPRIEINSLEEFDNLPFIKKWKELENFSHFTYHENKNKAMLIAELIVKGEVLSYWIVAFVDDCDKLNEFDIPRKQGII